MCSAPFGEPPCRRTMSGYFARTWSRAAQIRPWSLQSDPPGKATRVPAGIRTSVSARRRALMKSRGSTIAAVSARWFTIDPERGRQAEPVWPRRVGGVVAQELEAVAAVDEVRPCGSAAPARRIPPRSRPARTGVGVGPARCRRDRARCGQDAVEQVDDRPEHVGRSSSSRVPAIMARGVEAVDRRPRRLGLGQGPGTGSSRRAGPMQLRASKDVRYARRPPVGQVGIKKGKAVSSSVMSVSGGSGEAAPIAAFTGGAKPEGDWGQAPP